MKKPAIFLAVAFVLILMSALRPQAAQTSILEVGPGKPFAAPCAAITAATAGDTIEIDSSVAYSGDTCAWTTDNLTIRGVGGARAHIDARGQNAQGKGTWVIAGRNTVIENVEISGSAAAGGNGAAIRQQGDNLTVRNGYFHDNQEGIATDAAPASRVLIEFSEFARNGSGDGQAHNLSIGNVAQFIFRYNYAHHSKGGSLLQSRAAQNVIEYNRLSDAGTGSASRIDLPNGGFSYVVGNVIEQGRSNVNPTVLSYLEEGVTAGSPGRQLFVVNNTFVNHAGEGTFVFLASQAAPAVIKNNIFSGRGTVTNQLAAVQANNFAGNPGFVNAVAGDYHLKAGSPAIDRGGAPGANGSFSLAPAFQYVHPACAEGRKAVGAIDIGAYELNGGTGVRPHGSACGTASAASSITSTAGVTGQAANTMAAVAFATLATPTPTPVPSNGLVAAYGFNEGSGTAVHDVSGNNNNGTITGAQWTTGGRFGSALSFNGTNSLVAIPESASLDLKSALTLEAWVKPTAAPNGFQAILFKEMPTDTAYYLYRSGFSAAPLGGVYVGAEQSATAANGLALNSWSHLALTYNGTVEQLYVNGALVASHNQTGAVQTSTGVLHIGGDSVWGEYFLGLIDEVRIYNRALSAGEIQTDMNTAVASPTPPPAPGNLVVTVQDAGAGNILSFHLNVTPVSITNSSGVTTNLSTTGLPLELTHLDLAPTLGVPGASVPAGSYSSINLAVSNPQVVVLSNGVPTQATNVTLAQTSISVPLTALTLSAGGTLDLALDFDIPNSVSVDASGNYTITPVVHSASVTPSASSGMQLVDVVGQVVNLPASPANSFDFQVPNISGTVRIVTDANTVFDNGVTQFAGLQLNQFVEIEAALQPDGTFLAKYVELSASNQSLRVQGVMTSAQQNAQGQTTGVNLVQQY